MDMTNRLPKEVAVYELLEKLEMHWEQVDHEAAMDMAACEAVDEMLGVVMCKNLFLCNRQHTQFYLLMMPGDKPFKTKDLSHQIGSARLSFAEAEYMEQYLNITPGAVSVMGLMNDLDNHVQLLIDEDVIAQEGLGCHPCVNTSSVKLLTREVLEKFLPAVHHDYQVVQL